ncbi:MAG: OmpA family protein [Bacteroidota bacterium]
MHRITNNSFLIFFFKYKQIIILLIFLIWVLPLFSGLEKCPKIKNKDALKLYDKASEYFNSTDRERLKSSYDYLLEATKIEPEFYNAYYQLAMINYRWTIWAMQDKYDKENVPRYNNNFLNYLNKVIDICPSHEDYDSYYYLGEYYYVERDFTEAKKYFSIYLNSTENKGDHFLIATNYQQHMKTVEELINNPVEFNPVKLEGVCTEDDEFLPLISPDGELAFYTHRYFKKTKDGPTKKLIDEFSFSKRKDPSDPENEAFFDGEPMIKPFNQDYDQGGISITIDNNQLYITVCKLEKVRKDGGYTSYNNCDIYVSFNQNGEWSELRNLGLNVNGKTTWEGQPSISADGKVLYFASARPDNTLGGIDIYYSVKDGYGVWGQAQNLGSKINTKKDDKSPFIHSDSQTLYYASNGKHGIGGFDIYYSRFEKEVWSEPKNIGFPINTAEDDLGFVVSTNGKKAFFASNRISDSGGYDIYSFDLHQDARPEEVLLVKGELKNEKGKALTDAELVVKNTTTGIKSEAMIDKLTGKYAVAITIDNPEDEFIMTVRKENTAFTSAYIKPKENEKLVPIKVDMEVKRVEVGQPVEINDIYFNTNESVFDNSSMVILDNFIEWLQENPKVKIEIHGHTDNIGDKDINQQLSEDRAKNVFNYLLLMEIGSERMVKYVGFGEDKPIATNDTSEGRSKNRRVEFVIVGK